MEMKMPKEIQSKESSFIKGFSIRQCILIVLGIAAMASMYFLVFKKYNLGDFAIPLAGIFGVPFFAFAFKRKHGMRLSQYLLVYINDNIMSSKNRKASFQNVYEKWEKKVDVSTQNKKKVKSRFRMVKI